VAALGLVARHLEDRGDRNRLSPASSSSEDTLFRDTGTQAISNEIFAIILQVEL